MLAVRTGDLQGLMDALAPDVLLRADGGGIANAIRKPLTGAEPVARLLSRFAVFAPDGQPGPGLAQRRTGRAHPRAGRA
ncbi:hypothetical protein [Nocardioides convexus]|uniref:hypothetical protein n=1 Tax=Nocardioides convexus TaxID=2712224 RepID=UPI0024185EC2|nr:hypothetical protein [Nocardioides convexus]